MLTLLLILILVLLILYSWVQLLQDRKRQAFDGPFPYPVIGNGHLFWDNKKFLDNHLKLAKEYNNAFIVYLGPNRFLALSHPKYIEYLMSSQETITKGVSYKFLHSWLGFGLLTSTGDRWKMHRKLLTPAFHFAILQNFLLIFQKNCDVMISKLMKRADGSAFDMFDFVASAALDNVAESIMGVSVDAQNDSESEFVKAIKEMSQMIFLRIRNALLIFDFVFNLTPYKARHDKALNTLQAFTNNVIEMRRKELEMSNITNYDDVCETGLKNKRPFLDLLLLNEKNEGNINNKDIVDEVNTFMFEGMDTTTAGILFTLYCVSNHPEVQVKLLNEQKAALGSDYKKHANSNELSEMKYLENVIKESLRLYPSVPFIERMITRDIDEGGIRINKGTSVIIDIIHMQRHPDLFEDPLVFRPERFDANSKNPFSWLAFSAGPRNCIGQKFAMMEMKVTISSIIKNFQVLPTNTKLELDAALVLKSLNGFPFKLLPR